MDDGGRRDTRPAPGKGAPRQVDWDSGEGLVLWSFRHWVSGLAANDPRHWALVWNAFAVRLGAREGKAALAEFAATIKVLILHARRRLRYRVVCCSALSEDEARLLAFLDACQRGHRDRAAFLAGELVESRAVAALVRNGTGFAARFASHGLPLAASAIVMGVPLWRGRRAGVRRYMGAGPAGRGEPVRQWPRGA